MSTSIDSAGRPTSSESQQVRLTVISRNLTRLIAYIWQLDCRYLLAQVWIFLILALIPAASAYLSRIAIDALSALVRGDSEASVQVIRITVMSFGIALLSQLLTFIQDVYSQRLQVRVDYETRSSVFAKVQHLPLTFFDRPESHNILQRTNGQLGRQMVGTVNACFRLIGSLVTSISYLCFLSLADWRLPLGLLPIFGLTLWMNLRWGEQRYWLFHRQSALQREMSYLELTLSGTAAAKEIRLFGIGPWLISRWQRTAVRAFHEQQSTGLRQALGRTGLSGLASLISLGVSVTLIWLIGQGRFSVGSYVAFGAAVSGVLVEISQISLGFGQLFEQSLYVDNFFQLEALPDEQSEGDLPCPPIRQEGILVDRLSFKYEGTERTSLLDVSFRIRPGERIALVGENGSGKTTLVKCLLGLYLPTSGTIQYEGIDINRLNRAELRTRTTAIFQDFMQFALSARENVGIGHLPSLENEGLLYQAATRAGASPVVDRLPNGWETPLSCRWPGGVDLSGGEWQRLAMARALVRDADLFVLDEPTAALDPRAEVRLFEQFSNLTINKTTVFVSHRLGMTRLADRILVLKGGRLVEEGNHEELIRVGGEYARLYETQAKWYQ